MKKLIHLTFFITLIAFGVKAQESRVNNHWYFFQPGQPGLDVEWGSNAPESDQTTGGTHPGITGYFSTNVLYEANGFGSTPACYAISGSDGLVHVFSGDGTEAVATDQVHFGYGSIAARKDEIGLLPIPGYPDQFIVLARPHTHLPSMETGVFLMDMDGHNYDQKYNWPDIQGAPSLSEIGGTAPLLGLNVAPNECEVEYLIDGDAIATSVYDEVNNEYVVYSCGRYSNNLGDYVAIYKTVINFNQFDPTTITPPSVNFNSTPIAISDGSTYLDPESGYLTEMELSPNQQMLAVSDGYEIWFIQLDGQGDYIPGSDQYVSNADCVGLEFSAENSKLFATTFNGTYPLFKNPLTYIEIVNNALVQNGGAWLTTVVGSDNFSNSQIELGTDRKVYALKGNSTGNAATGLVSYNETTGTVDDNALPNFFNNLEVPIPDEYMDANGTCDIDHQFFTIQDQIDALTPMLVISKKTIADYNIAISTPAKDWEFLVEDQNGNMVTDYPKTNDDGIATVTLKSGFTYKITEIFKEGWIRALDNSSPSQLTGYQTITAANDEIYHVDFANYYVEDQCKVVPGIVAYFHFEETSGNEAMNVFGENGLFFPNTAPSTALAGDVIGGGNPQVPSVSGKDVPNFSNADNTLDISQNDIRILSNSYPEIDFSTQSFTIETYVKLNSPSSATDMTIASKTQFRQNVGIDVGWEFGVHNNEPYFEFGGSNGEQASYRANIVGSFIPNTTDFHHVAFVVDRPNNEIKVYVNGANYSTLPLNLPFSSSSSVSSSTHLMLGDNLNGILDEFAIFNRKLSASEVNDAMNKCFDYMEVEPLLQTNIGGQDYIQGEFTIYNGHTAQRDLLFSIAPIMGAAFSACTVNGPGVIWGNHGREVLSAGASVSNTFKIPMDLNANPSDVGCFEILVYNDDFDAAIAYRLSSSMMNQLPEPLDEKTDVESVEMETAISVYPNPAKNRLFLDTDDDIESILIYNANGQLVKTMIDTNPGTSQIDVSELTRGFYTLKIQTQKSYSTSTFIKQ